MGISPMSWSDINSWASLRRIKLSSYELSLIRILDSISIQPRDKK